MSSTRSYFFTFVALMGLLVATVGVAYVDLGVFNLPVAMTISFAKAALIIWFFMHVRRTGPLTWVLAGAGFFWLLILLSLAMLDYSTRGWEVVRPF